MPAVFGSTLKAEVAQRQFEDGSGLGWSSEIVGRMRTTASSCASRTAPGGSDAFARATDELVANVSERLTSRASVTASAWRTTDVTSVFSGLRANGYSVRPQYTIRGGTAIALEMRSYVFDAASRAGTSSAGGSFGSRDQQLGISLSSYLRQYYFNTSAYLGNVTRTVTPLGQSTVSSRTPRNYWTTSAGWSGVGGVLELQTRIEQTRDAGGFVNQQSMVGLRASQVGAVVWRHSREGEVQRLNGFGGENSSILRAAWQFL